MPAVPHSFPGARIPAGRAGVSLAVLVGFLALVLAVGPALAQDTPRPLNDTGQVTCYDNSAATGTVGDDASPEHAGFEGQDCSQGHSAEDALGAMPKVGASVVKGRDYTKICMNGEAAGEGACPANPAVGEGATQWGCTRDNVTGLIWEVKLAAANRPRYYGHTYTWYDTNASVNGGNSGAVGTTDTCADTLGGNACNTTNFRDAVDALTGADRLCGANDWRLPTAKELQSLVDYQRSAGPLIDPDFFPNTASAYYWSGQNQASSDVFALITGFNGGFVAAGNKASLRPIRLVRSGL